MKEKVRIMQKKKIQHMWIHKYERSKIENKIKKNKAGK